MNLVLYEFFTIFILQSNGKDKNAKEQPTGVRKSHILNQIYVLSVNQAISDKQYYIHKSLISIRYGEKFKIIV